MNQGYCRFVRLFIFAVCLLAASATSALAQTPAPAGQSEAAEAEWRKRMEDMVKQMGATIQGLQKEVGDLKAERAQGWAKDGAPASAPTAAQAQENQQLKKTVEGLQDEVIKLNAKTEKPKDAVKVTTKGGLKVESEDGQYSFSPSGRLQLESAWHDQDRARLGDGTEIRRAYLGASGKITKLWDYRIIGEFISDTNFQLNDAFIQFNGLDPVTLTLGNFKEPFSLEDQTSNLFTSFMERSLISGFSPGRKIGFMVDAKAPVSWAPMTAAVGIFGESVTSRGAATASDTSEGDEGMDIAGRLTIAPTLAKDEFIHLGAGAFYRDPSDSSVRFRQRPGSHVTDTRYLDTGSFSNVDNVWAVQPEVAIVYGPFSVQGEYAWVAINRKGQANNIDLDGWYAEATVFLTGESRVYKNGKFDRISPKRNFLDGSGFAGGLGAIQIGARYDQLDFNDRGVGLLEGRENTLTLGATWITNPYVRFMFETVFVDNDKNALNPSVIPLNPILGAAGDDPTIYQFRGQVDF